MVNLNDIAEKLKGVEGGRVWVAENASEPHVRVYFGGESYVAVTDEGDAYGIQFVAGEGISRRRRQRLSAQCVARVEAALGVGNAPETVEPEVQS